MTEKAGEDSVLFYSVLDADDLNELIQQVRDFIAQQGCRPLGGIAVADGRFYQAMIG